MIKILCQIDMKQNSELVKEINNYAMRNGIVLGVFGILSLLVFKWSFTLPAFSTLFGVMLLGGPVLGAYLTIKFRNDVEGTDGAFSFARGFLHALFMGFYASIWVALAVFVYLQYFDNGSIFAAYGKSLETPEMQQYLQQSGVEAQFDAISGGKGVQGAVDAMQSLGSATYASISLYLSMVLGPVISAVIGLLVRRR